MVNRIKAMFQDRSSTRTIRRHGTQRIDPEDLDHRREEQSVVRAALRQGWGFNTSRITMSREFYRIKQQVRGSKRRRHTKLLFQSTPSRNGEKNFGKLERAANKKSGNFFETPARKTTRPPKPWSWPPISTCHRTLWPRASTRLASTTECRSRASTTPWTTSKTTNTRSWETRSSRRIRMSRTWKSSYSPTNSSRRTFLITYQLRNWNSFTWTNFRSRKLTSLVSSQPTSDFSAWARSL